MLRMLLRRCFLGAVTVAIVSAIIFLGVELLPGDACTAFLERDAKGQMLENCRKDFGLDRPALTRYFEWDEKFAASGCCVTERWRAHGDFSWRYHGSLARQTD